MEALTQQILESKIPEGQQNLINSCQNLEDVAQFCEDNYAQSHDRRAALEETMKYMTQSLASVAYQVNVLAGDFLTLLDAQEANVQRLNQEATGLGLKVKVHKERVARRQIGQLTTNKISGQVQGMRQPGIIYPDHIEKLTKYVRRPIDYSELDGLGHGGMGGQPSMHGSSARSAAMHDNSAQQLSRQSSRSVSSNQSFQEQQRPRLQSSGSNAAYYGAPQHLQHQQQQPPQHPMGQQAPQMKAQPTYQHQQLSMQEQQQLQYRVSMMQQQQQQLPQQQQATSPPPPPPPDVQPTPQYMMQPQDPFLAGAPLEPEDAMMPPPPPPPDGFGAETTGEAINHLLPQSGDHMQSRTGEDPPWAPQYYLQRVIAIYDYAADKDDELTFQEDDTIYVVKKNDDGWWEGVMFGGRTGLFPGNYVE